MKDLLKIQDLTMYFQTLEGPVKAVDGISLSVKMGQAMGLVGESGCGKTATALTIMNLLPNNSKILSGSITLNGVDLLKLSVNQMRKIRGKSISIVFQDPLSFLNPVLKAGDQVADVLRLHMNMDKKEARKRVIELFNMVQIPGAEDVYDYYPHEMSGGMRQRVIISAALACEPELIILDEPTTALDVTVQSQILDLIRDLKKELNLSIILITHDLGVVAEICDHVLVMYAGKIVEDADIFSLYKDPKHPYTQGLLRSNVSVLKSKSPESMLGVPPNLMNPPSGCRFHPRCPHEMNICSVEDPPMHIFNNRQSTKCWLYKKEI